jgi:uncharacterized membrane protein
MNPRTALVLRLLGPLIQIACLMAMFQTQPRTWSVAGISGESLLLFGFLLGCVLVVIGLFFSRKPQRSRPPEDRL